MISIDAVALLIEGIYEAGLDPQKWPAALEQITRAIGANVADLKLTDVSRARFTLVSVGMDRAAVERYLQYYGQIDPILPAAELKPVGTLTTDREVVSKSWLTRTEFYNDWVRPQDFHDCAVLTLLREQTRVAVLCLAAPERADAFDPQLLDLLRRLTPHLQRAAQVTLKMADLELLRNAGLEALDSLSDGVVLTDANARVVFANRAAEAMFSRRDGIGVDRSGLCAATAGQTMALRRLIAVSGRQADIAETRGSLLLDRPSERRPLSVTVVPMRRETAWSLAAPPLAIVFVADPEREAEMSDVRLRAFYGVTPTEATIARLISRGSGVKAAARVLGIAPSTARTHLHRVFEKTGTSRQAELTNLVNSLASLSGNLTE
jgi:DNA-binding CsgD family transcriptional regulator/PAS domain-containing protein